MSDIDIDCSKSQGRIKPLHGVNNGPVCYGSLVDVSAYYKELGVPYARLHDPNWPHPREVDIPQIFPNFDADPQDPASYDFRRTDDYLQSIVDTGAGIIYRLGTSIEHTQRKYYIRPPSDFAKWAQICIGIIKHYNQGWADGFRHAIPYWEIWNEPDGDPAVPPEKSGMWTGTPEQYFELYKTAATAIKQFDPSLKVGGFAATMVHPVFTKRFMDYCTAEHLPLDFFSWHTYTDHPAKAVANALWVRRLLDEHGYTGTESICDEWNYSRFDPDMKGVFRSGNEYATHRLFERSKGEEGASFDAAVLIALQDCSVDQANFYDGAPTSFWSLFDPYGVPQKNYYAFKAFRELLNTPDRLGVTLGTPVDGFYVLAGLDPARHEVALLVSNFDGPSREYDLCFEHLPCEQGTWRVYRLDGSHDLDLVQAQGWRGTTLNLPVYLAQHSVTLIRLGAE
jgi:hypothetical protein